MADEAPQSPHDQTAIMVAIEVRAGLAKHEGECGARWQSFKDTMDRFFEFRRERDKDIDAKFQIVEGYASQQIASVETRMSARLSRWEHTIIRLTIAIVASAIGHLIIFMINR